MSRGFGGFIAVRCLPGIRSGFAILPRTAYGPLMGATDGRSVLNTARPTGLPIAWESPGYYPYLRGPDGEYGRYLGTGDQDGMGCGEVTSPWLSRPRESFPFKELHR